MPAIRLAQLRQQCAILVDHFHKPEIFVRNLHYLLSNYSDRTHRTGQVGEPPPLLLTYNVPKPVLRQVEIEIKSSVTDNPQSALILCDRLWIEPYFEMRLLAVSILGQITPEPPAPIVGRVKEWSKSATDDQLRKIIFEQGLRRLRQESPDSLIHQIESWLGDSNLAVKKLGLQALIPLISTISYENTPVFFRQLSPYVRECPSVLRNDVRDALQGLASTSPIETAHFLRQYLSSTSSTDAAWFTRQCMPLFPPDTQESLRELLRAGTIKG